MSLTTPRDETPTGERATAAPRRITEFRPEDAAAVAEMFNGSQDGWPGGFWGGTHITPLMVLDALESERPLAVFLSWEGDACAGFCSFCEYPEEPGVAGYVELLNSASAYRGRGHGRDLLKAALRRTVELGYRRLDLHTWAGNMRAVPLYKKSGYFWVPDSSVHMENYLPLLLGLPALADFWREVDWYQAQVRDLTVREDFFLDGKMRTYPYEFRRGNRYVKATIDAAARGLTALETERWRVSCRVDDRRLIAGRSGAVRWEVENHTGSPLNLTLSAQGVGGLRVVKEETTTVEDRYVAEAPLSAAADYQPPAHGQPSPRVASLLLIDGLPVRLETGVEVKPPVEVRLAPRRTSLLAGQPRDVVVELKSNLDEPATAALTLTPSAGLTLAHPEGSRLEITIEAESYAGATVRVRAEEAGVQELEVRGTVAVRTGEIALAPVHLALPAVAVGGALAFQTERPRGDFAEREWREEELRVEVATRRLVVALRHGQFHMEDSATGDYLAGGTLSGGPPFAWQAQEQVTHTATVERQDGAVTVLLRGATPHLPVAVVEHELRFSTDGLLQLRTAIANTGVGPLEAQAAVDIWAGQLPRTVLPTRYGLVASDTPEFPDWEDLAFKEPSTFTEGWAARDGDGQVAGALWSEATRVEVGRWNLVGLRQGSRALGPGERRLTEPVYLYAGPGDWQTVRAYWRRFVAPDASPEAPPSRDAVALESATIPAALLAGQRNAVRLSSLTSRELNGELRLATPADWTIEPDRQDVRGLRAGQDQELTVTVQHTERRPGAVPVRARLRTERASHLVFDGALLDLGQQDGTIRVTEESEAGQQLLTVDNGCLRFRLAAGFIGSIVALETVADGVNHVLSAFPEPREFGWIRPWFGGIHAAVYGPGQQRNFGSPARLYEETFGAEPIEEAGKDGRRWRGVAVRSVLQSRGQRGLTLRASYLTLPGSNLLAVRVAVRNATSATITAETALVAYLQPGGTVEDAELLLDPEGRQRLRRAQRTIEGRGEDWAAVRNPADGRTVAIACCRDVRTAPHVQHLDWGTLGGHSGVSASLRLGPQEERGFLCFLAVARDEEEARAYRALASARALP